MVASGMTETHGVVMENDTVWEPIWNRELKKGFVVWA
jgi:hypothetical protein